MTIPRWTRRPIVFFNSVAVDLLSFRMFKWVPMSSFLNPRVSSLTAVTAHRRASMMSEDLMCLILSFLQTAET